MSNQPHTQILSLIWKLLTVLIIPIIMILYIKAMSALYGDFSFSDLDQGKNLHKWVVLAIYLAFLLCWNRLNPYVVNLLKRMEY
ncbi:hypothetical protein N8878_06240 [Psychromonas sp.]|nr:hypothetical protein [Psychromonas sp.]